MTVRMRVAGMHRCLALRARLYQARKR